MVDALSDVSSGALVPMADNLSQATPGKLFQDGIINVSALQAVADSLSNSSKVFKGANKKMQGIGDTYIAQVTELVDKAKDGFATLNGAVDADGDRPRSSPDARRQRPDAPLSCVRYEQRRDSCLRRFRGSRGVMSVTDGQMSIGEFVPHWTQRG